MPRHNLMAVSSACLHLLLLLLFSEAAAASLSSLSGLWFDPHRNGEGINLQVVDEDRVVLAWYTYDEAGNPRWLVDVGIVERDGHGAVQITFPALMVTRGGRFGSAFDPQDVEFTVVGTAAVTFESCNTATLAHSAFGQTGALGLVRLTRLMGVDCNTPFGDPRDIANSSAGQSGTWFDPARNGEGITIQWQPNGEAVLTWYTYGTTGEQLWLVAGGGRNVDGILSFDDVYTAKGGIFGSEFDPADVVLTRWGSLSFTSDCSSGLLSYESEDARYGSGELAVARLSGIGGVGCPWLPPALSDLASVSVIKIHILPGTPSEPNFIQAGSVSDDGSVFAMRRDGDASEVLKWSIASLEWQVLSDPIMQGPFVRSSRDGQKALVNATAPSTPSMISGGNVLPLQRLLFDESFAEGAAKSLDYVVGVGRFTGEALLRPWIWSTGVGQVELATDDATRGTRPRAVSSDGRTVAGSRIVPSCGPNGCIAAGTAGVLWGDPAQPPSFLFDPQGRALGGATACSDDCRVLFGSDSKYATSVHEAYAWFGAGVMRYLGSIPGAVPGGASSYFVADATADGAMAVGQYSALMATASGHALVSDAMVWTALTGIFAVSSLDEVVLADLGWHGMTAVSVSPNGEWILLSGEFDPGMSQPLEARAALIRIEGRALSSRLTRQ